MQEQISKKMRVRWGSFMECWEMDVETVAFGDHRDGRLGQKYRRHDAMA